MREMLSLWRIVRSLRSSILNFNLAALAAAVETFGGVDMLINNSGAMQLLGYTPQ